MIKRNIMVVAPTAETLQGTIRAIEALDSENEIGIIHGSIASTVTETEAILAEVAQAAIVTVGHVEQVDHPLGRDVVYIPLDQDGKVLNNLYNLSNTKTEVDYSEDPLTTDIKGILMKHYKDIVPMILNQD